VTGRHHGGVYKQCTHAGFQRVVPVSHSADNEVEISRDAPHSNLRFSLSSCCAVCGAIGFAHELSMSKVQPHGWTRELDDKESEGGRYRFNTSTVSLLKSFSAEKHPNTAHSKHCVRSRPREEENEDKKQGKGWLNAQGSVTTSRIKTAISYLVSLTQVKTKIFLLGAKIGFRGNICSASVQKQGFGEGGGCFPHPSDAA
jgi:hypothetical protein